MKTNIFVSDLMTREPITISPEADLLECAKKMVKKRVSSLILSENKELLGLITDQDLLWALVKKSKEDLSEIKAIEISPKKIVTLKPSDDIYFAINKFKKNKFERFPVILNKKIVGMITVKDIISFNPEFYPEFEELEGIKEQSDKIKRINLAKKRKFFREGICEMCGKKDLLEEFNGMLICESCKNSL
jgi:CBS domain-containing protein